LEDGDLSDGDAVNDVKENELTNELINELTNELTNEVICELTNELTDEVICELTNELVTNGFIINDFITKELSTSRTTTNDVTENVYAEYDTTKNLTKNYYGGINCGINCGDASVDTEKGPELASSSLGIGVLDDDMGRSPVASIQDPSSEVDIHGNYNFGFQWCCKRWYKRGGSFTKHLQTHNPKLPCEAEPQFCFRLFPTKKKKETSIIGHIIKIGRR